MKLNKLLFLLLMCICFCSSCKRETEITGEVFVVTKGAGNYKFGLVEIGVLPLEDAKKYLLTRQDSVEKAWTETITDNKKCDDWERKFSKYDSDYRAEKLINDCRDEAENSKEAVYSLYFQNLPPMASTSVTDSDGKFSLTVPKTGSYAVLAKAERTVTGARKEQYFWFLEIKANGSPQKLTLSNNNMLASNAPGSLIKAGK